MTGAAGARNARGRRLCALAALLLAGCGDDEPTAGPEVAPGRASTAGPGVTVIEPPFPMVGLGRERTVRIYLPPGYGESDRRYPVLYMHDGQNLFDDSTSYAGEWGVDEALDALARDGLGLIVVGIDNGQALRAGELVPWPNPQLEGIGDSDADAYLAFLADTVKPWVDARYRTLPGREHTGLMGSSFGGLASHYAMLERSDVFARFGIFSPSYWASEMLVETTRTAPLPADIRVALQVGEREGGDMLAGFERMADLLREKGLEARELWVRITPEGEHHETAWREEFPAAVRFLFEPGSGSVRP